ncbi:MAG: substrate-binding domain-containing protein [Verrucomicrobia bacterium]|nr:substrate-binding domain-containing protein [Verrucomicrobiota bacterium]
MQTREANNLFSRRICDRLAHELVRGKYSLHKPLPTHRQWAKEFGVSTFTVCNALEELKTAGIIESAEGSRTFLRQIPSEQVLMQRLEAARILRGKERAPPRPLTRSSATNSAAWVCLFLDPRFELYGNFINALMEHLQAACVLPVNATWQLGRGENQIQHLINRWRAEPPQAVVIQGLVSDRDEAVLRVCQEQIRVVAVFRLRQFDVTGWHTVNPDMYSAFRMASQRLMAAGHTRIGVVVKPRLVVPDWRHTHRKATMWHTEQVLGVGHVLREAGHRHGLTIHYNESLGVSTEADIVRLVRWLNRPDRPTAVVADDFRVPGIMRAAERLHLRVPENLAVIGVGDSPVALNGGFPRISLGYERIAREVVDLALAAEDQMQHIARHVVVPPSFVSETTSVQESTLQVA